MELDTKCLVCERDSEDGGHLFFKCKLAKQVWNLLPVGIGRNAAAAGSAKLGHGGCVSHLGGERDCHYSDGDHIVVIMDEEECNP
jgi:hypothetical protein